MAPSPAAAVLRAGRKGPPGRALPSRGAPSRLLPQPQAPQSPSEGRARRRCPRSVRRFHDSRAPPPGPAQRRGRGHSCRDQSEPRPARPGAGLRRRSRAPCGCSEPLGGAGEQQRGGLGEGGKVPQNRTESHGGTLGMHFIDTPWALYRHICAVYRHCWVPSCAPQHKGDKELRERVGEDHKDDLGSGASPVRGETAGAGLL